MKTRRDVWQAFADQFTGKEPRVAIPNAGLRAIEAGLSRADAYDVWRFEVTATVMANNEFDDWAEWSRDWLVAQISRRDPRRKPLSHVGYWLSNGGLHANWRAIEACMNQLTMSTSPSELAAFLTWLAAHFFDFVGEQRAPACAPALACVYRRIFLPTFRSLVRDSDGGVVACNARVMDALARLEATGPYRT